MKNYTENVSDFLRAVGPYINGRWYIQNGSLPDDIQVIVLQFVSTTWKDMYIEEWKERIYFEPPDFRLPSLTPEFVEIIKKVMPGNNRPYSPSDKALEFLNWLANHGYETSYETEDY